jgi:hypothetical protein
LPSSERREFTESFLVSRVDFAIRVIPGHFGPDEEILTNNQFLESLKIPVSFIKDPNLGLCVETSMYDELNGDGQAESAIEHLRIYGSSDTRRLANGAITARVKTEEAPLAPRSLHFRDPLNFCESRDGDIDIHCSELSSFEALGLLYAILKAETASHAVEYEGLMPLAPPAGYVESSPILSPFAANSESYVRVLRAEFGIEIILFEEHQGFRIRGEGSRAIAQQLVLLAFAYARRKQRNVTIGVVSLVAAVGGAVAYLVC